MLWDMKSDIKSDSPLCIGPLCYLISVSRYQQVRLGTYHSDLFWKIYSEISLVQLFWKATNLKKMSPTCFDTTEWKQLFCQNRWEIFSNFEAFSYYLNFTHTILSHGLYVFTLIFTGAYIVEQFIIQSSFMIFFSSNLYKDGGQIAPKKKRSNIE